jgi:hypothetical protein
MLGNYPEENIQQGVWCCPFSVKPAFASSCLLLDEHKHLHLTKWNIPLVFRLKCFRCFEAHKFENVCGVIMETEIDRFLTS